jgi:hypothetical protein
MAAMSKDNRVPLYESWDSHEAKEPCPCGRRSASNGWAVTATGETKAELYNHDGIVHGVVSIGGVRQLDPEGHYGRPQ